MNRRDFFHTAATGALAAAATQVAVAQEQSPPTIRLAPTRVVAYINLGDAYVKLDRRSEAKQAYDKYLELAPNSREAADVAAKLKALAP